MESWFELLKTRPAHMRSKHAKRGKQQAKETRQETARMDTERTRMLEASKDRPKQIKIAREKLKVREKAEAEAAKVKREEDRKAKIRADTATRDKRVQEQETKLTERKTKERQKLKDEHAQRVEDAKGKWRSPYREGTWDTGWEGAKIPFTERRIAGKYLPSRKDIRMQTEGTKPTNRWKTQVRGDTPDTAQTQTIDQILQRPEEGIPQLTSKPVEPARSKYDSNEEYEADKVKYKEKVQEWENKREGEEATRAKWKKENPIYAEHGGYKPTQRTRDVDRDKYVNLPYADKQTIKLIQEDIKSRKEGLKIKEDSVQTTKDLITTLQDQINEMHQANANEANADD